MRKPSLAVVICIAAGLVAALPAAASGKLAYTEVIAADGTLTVSFNEPSQKKASAVGYRLDATATATWTCTDGTTFSNQSFPSNTATIVPGGNGHAVGSISVTPQSSSNGCVGTVLQRIDYTNVALTNLTTGHVYPLDSMSRTFP